MSLPRPTLHFAARLAIALTTLAWTMNLVHPYFYLAISIMLCIVIGYLASLLRMVGDEQYPFSLLMGQPLHLLQHLLSQGRIQGREGFIQQ